MKLNEKQRELLSEKLLDLGNLKEGPLISVIQLRKRKPSITQLYRN